MKRLKRPPVEIFNIAFLDIISCAFGAVVLLILLSKNGDQGEQSASNAIARLVEQVVVAKQTVSALQAQFSKTTEDVKAAEQQAGAAASAAQNLESSIPRAQQTLQQLQDQARSLREQIRVANARMQTTTPIEKPSSEVGGIPTDADYVIFVIDNSGSMSGGGGWNRVVKVVEDIIKNHPQMKGFQVMAADGSFMYPGQEGKWLTDNGGMRDRAIARLQGFRGGASAPEEGILRAVDLYKKTQAKVSMYVFGDDYRPSDLDNIVTQITERNRDTTGKPIIRIHGVGFYRPVGGNVETFAAFMQAVAKRNRGAFVGLNF